MEGFGKVRLDSVCIGRVRFGMASRVEVRNGVAMRAFPRRVKLWSGQYCLGKQLCASVFCGLTGYVSLWRGPGRKAGWVW